MKRLVFALGVLFGLAMPVVAQDTVQTDQNAINFCAAELAYTLPEGWISGGIHHFVFNVLEVTANSDAVLNKELTDLNSSEAMIIVEVMQRAYWTSLLEVDTRADVATILQASVEIMGNKPDYLGEISHIRLGDGSAVTQESTYESIYGYTIGFDVGDQAIAFVILNTGIDGGQRWNQTALDIAESLRFSAPSFLGGSETISLTESFAASNCFVAVAYPQNWIIYVPLPQPIALGQLDIQVANYGTWRDHADDILASGQVYMDVHAEILPSLSGGDPYFLANYTGQVVKQTGYVLDDQTQTTVLNYPAIISQLHEPDKAANVAAEALAITVKYDNYAVASVTLHTAPGELDRWHDVALAVAESIWYAPENLPSQE